MGNNRTQVTICLFMTVTVFVDLVVFVLSISVRYYLQSCSGKHSGNALQQHQIKVSERSHFQLAFFVTYCNNVSFAALAIALFLLFVFFNYYVRLLLILILLLPLVRTTTSSYSCSCAKTLTVIARAITVFWHTVLDYHNWVLGSPDHI